MRANLVGMAVLACVVSARADEPAPLQNTGAFEKAYAASFYEFDACGDGVAGKIYRSALADRLRQCPFTDAAKKRFQSRAAAQRRQSGQAMAKLIETNGGLPARLEGMTRTCREQRDSPEYQQIRGRLDDFSAGKLGSDAVVAQPCDAAEITP